MSESDTRPFPIQGRRQQRRSEIPWWLAEEAYADYQRRYRNGQSLQQIADRGGFGREELLMHLRGENMPRPLVRGES